MRLALAALLALAPLVPGPARAAPAAAPNALVAAARALADEVGAPADGRRGLLLAVEAHAPALGATLETALDAALSARGYAVTPQRGPGDAEAAARARGQDWLLRVRAGLVPGRREVALVGELIPAWPSFFLQRRPDARAVPPRVVQARAPADAETLLLAREARAAGAPFAAVRTLARLPGRVLALAIGEVAGPGSAAIVAATAATLFVLSPSGERLATWELPAPGPGPGPRAPAVALAVGDFGGGRIAVLRAGAARGEVLALRGGRLEAAGTLDAAPLCAGDAGRLFGAFAPGSGVFLDLLSPLVDPDAAPRSARTLYGAAAAPRGGRVAFAVLGTDLRLDYLGPDLVPLASAPLATGSGFALADLDGDGTAELVASSPDPAAPEKVRVLAPLATAPLRFESAPVAGAILSGAGGDVTGDGVDDAVLGAVAPGPGGEPGTDLLLVTSDPRELP